MKLNDFSKIDICARLWAFRLFYIHVGFHEWVRMQEFKVLKNENGFYL